jgi:hypothetical protein
VVVFSLFFEVLLFWFWFFKIVYNVVIDFLCSYGCKFIDVCVELDDVVDWDCFDYGDWLVG